MRTILSDVDDASQGPVGVSLHGLAVGVTGEIIVGSAPPTWIPDLYRVDPLTGHRALLSDSSDRKQGKPFQRIVEIAVVQGDDDRDDHNGHRSRRHGHHGHESRHGFEDSERTGPDADRTGDWLISPFGR
jgi:hypothetical protein